MKKDKTTQLIEKRRALEEKLNRAENRKKKFFLLEKIREINAILWTKIGLGLFIVYLLL